MLKVHTYLLLLVMLLIGFGLQIKGTANNPTYSNQQASPNPNFLFLSDIHLNTTSNSTDYGSDTGMDLWNLFLSKTDSILAGPNAPSFIIYTGDLPAHYSWSSSAFLPLDGRTTHNANITAILSGLRSIANKYHKPLFYLPGNNDGLAGDYYSFTDAQQQTPLSLSTDSINPFPALNINRSGKKAPCIVSNPNPSMGYYSARPIAGLRIIALNTVMYSPDFATNDGSDIVADRNLQMKWLAGQLANAKSKHEKVYLTMHVPPGMDAYSNVGMWQQPADGSKSWLNTFLTLTNRYQNTIAGILYGHTHMDEVRRLYDSTGTKITEVAISCPGVTPQHHNNPGFKTVQYDAITKELMDFTTFYTQPTTVNYWGNATYNFNATYQGMPSMSIYQRLSTLPFNDVNTYMSSIFTVKAASAKYPIQQGIEVKWGQ